MNDDAVYLTYRVACIAGKSCACSRCRRLRSGHSPVNLTMRHAWAARLSGQATAGRSIAASPGLGSGYRWSCRPSFAAMP
ncbi:hypothetical protein C4K24_3703 [Pseudomonas chlororaphis subsp. aurantiaca]|nr:hypothetical protein C4K24_3703 [Pseudomonas chlororaphis subsp. aurantiaca]